ncbi:N-acetyltransferase [Brevibacillus fluminis]|uniref:N-acetyltransferase n=1 Tax=Brevibacillus fluminis TaxID=511487 RepID=A0A3M8DPJ2_9BACL|nr:GNAT family N-acetyltransferase [Brevibacillus fluminis]RNB90038.1 N-acetyltransferase [Brevibacillus fluminis]
MTTSKDMWRKGNYAISTDKRFLQEDVIYGYLHEKSYWSKGIDREVVRRSIEQSAFCFGVFQGEPGSADCRQVGFARVISDCATFAYLCDVFILPEHSGVGLGKWLMEVITQFPPISGVRRFLLATRDAHGLYAQYGFEPLAKPESFMAISRSQATLPER